MSNPIGPSVIPGVLPGQQQFPPNGGGMGMSPIPPLSPQQQEILARAAQGYALNRQQLLLETLNSFGEQYFTQGKQNLDKGFQGAGGGG